MPYNSKQTRISLRKEPYENKTNNYNNMYESSDTMLPQNKAKECRTSGHGKEYNRYNLLVW